MSPSLLKDRGPAQYFHGRKEIIDSFANTLELYRSEKGGTTYLIQGAPGAGKTALLDVLSNNAKSCGWAVAKIGIKNLFSPAPMAQTLGKSYTIDSEYALKGGIKFLEGGLVESVAGHASPEEVLKHLAPQTGLILLLDEAQRLNKIPDDSEIQIVAGDTLDVIHNGGLGRPIMLLAAGLGTTESAFWKLGISRSEGDCMVQLGRLDKESECAVIREWLVKDGGAEGDPHVWIKAIAGQTHGWPQHIISYMKPAVAFLKSHNHRMTDDGLEFVLARGSEYRTMYYKKRARGIDKKKRQVIAEIFNGVPSGETIEFDDIMSALKEEYSHEEAGNLFNKALERGIIDEREDGDYGIPIPSFHTWLIDEYASHIHQPILSNKNLDQSMPSENPQKSIGSKSR